MTALLESQEELLFSAWKTDFFQRINSDPALAREFADYQCNFSPGELRKKLPKYFSRLVLEEAWSFDQFERGVIGIVCMRKNFMRGTFELAHDETAQRPQKQFEKKKDTSPSTRRWKERQKNRKSHQLTLPKPSTERL